MNPFEDNWQDVLHKAMRGLSIDETILSQSSGIPPQEVKSLLEGNLHKNNLLHLAPVLSLDPQSLLDLANEIPPISVRLPSKPASADEVQGVDGAQKLSVQQLLDASSTDATKQFAAEVEFGKKSIALPKQMLCFTTPFHNMKVHSYLLWSEKNKRAVAFDTGTNSSLLLEELSKHQLTLHSIFLTHSHRDHLAELNTLIEATGAEAWIHSAELVPQTKPFSPPFSWTLDNSITIEARSTPGHSPGGTTYVIRGLSSPVAIVGDAIFARSVGGISPSAYPSALEAIQNNILSLPPETILAPGHGPLTTVGEELKHNPFFG